ncbi:putative MFS family arabinose efflux permease [Streptomyces sp. 2333.5]|uniref:MFS transporter n=1 Tax=unclassified Streptomyces TaxID=2593676 RepID=UPI000896E375|nr:MULTISPECIES: MFS transporter [unclassified Streptomyces]PJJ05130.1 putative MFS family arabinose efflux permease [Streptomyces sp. 2333.5]SEE68765.1 Predicted arabinose efflux permease, MFS family [Streptomyces sp. 2314.4]SEE94598.1 Predicted arabinose efflux permease, MFS family [Streptomyces sp. 2112.2]
MTATPEPAPPCPSPPLTALPTDPPLWRDRRFVLLTAARTISVLGNGFARVALSFAVLALPGAGPGQLSLVLACQAVPQLAFVLVGGVLADRVSRSRLMIAADLVGAAAYAGLAAMVLTGHAPLWALCSLAALAGTATALFSPAMDGVIPLLVPAGRLQRANGLLRVGMNSSMLLGLALSGVVVALVGAGWALALNAASFVVSALLIRGLRLSARVRPRASGWSELRDGWREFAGRQWLWVVVVQYAVVVAALNANAGVLGPLATEGGLGGARSWSLIVAAQALGTILGAGLAARLRVHRPVLVAVLATFPAALPIALLAVRAPVPLIALAMFGSGIAPDVFGVLWATTLQREVPEAALSRVSSYDWFGSLAFAPLGLLVAGPVAAHLGVGRTLAVCATLIVLATAAALLSPQVRGLRTLRPAPGDEAPDGP